MFIFNCSAQKNHKSEICKNIVQTKYLNNSLRALNACSEIIPIVFCRVYTQISIAGAHIWSKTQATFYVCTASSGARPMALWNIWQISKLTFFLVQQNIWHHAIICNVRRYFLPSGNAVKSSQIIREKGWNLESRKYPNLGVESNSI